MKIRTVMFVTALEQLKAECETLIEALRAEEDEQISDFDDKLDVVLEARNSWCQAENVEIEDGEIHWELSEAQRIARAEKDKTS